MHKKIISTIAIATILGVTTVTSYAQTNISDINNHWANKQIQSFVNNGYVNGYENGTFKPDNSITRAEFVKIVNRFFGFESKQNINFRDVNKSDWFYNDVCSAKKAGYINGYEDGTFKPNQPITREEVSKILVSIKNNKDFTYDKIQKFIDNTKISSWAKPYIEGAIEAGYIKGNPKGELNPTNNITRAESVVMISRIDNPESSEAKNNPPRISYDSVWLTEGDKFDYSMLNIRVTDPEDGDIPSDKIQISGNVDTSKAGGYAVTIKATDKQGRTSIKNALVSVEAKPSNPLYYTLEDSKFREATKTEFLKLLNDYRQENGKKKLIEKDNLTNLADSWSVYKSKLGFSSERDHDDKGSNDVYPQYGGSSSEVNFSTVAYYDALPIKLDTPETLAKAIFDEAKKDVGYNATILNYEFKGIGFGYYPRNVDLGTIVVCNTLEFSLE